MCSTHRASSCKTKLTLRQNAPESLARQTGAYPSWLQMLDRLDDLVLPKAARRAG